MHRCRRIRQPAMIEKCSWTTSTGGDKLLQIPLRLTQVMLMRSAAKGEVEARSATKVRLVVEREICPCKRRKKRNCEKIKRVVLTQRMDMRMVEKYQRTFLREA